jgi:hypothetical protein
VARSSYSRTAWAEARAFDERFNLIASSSDPVHLFVPLKDVRGLIGLP